MVELHVSKDFDVAAEKVWALLVDFGEFEKWWPIELDRFELEGEGLGMIRHLYLNGLADPVSERLDSLDHENMVLCLSIIRVMPAGMTEYNATGTITKTGPDSCRMDYKGVFTAEKGRDEGASSFLLGAYETMFQGIGDTAKQM
jgi:hypothetical protein